MKMIGQVAKLIVPNSGSLGQIDNNLLRLPGLMLPRAPRVLPGAGGHGGGGRGLLEHCAGEPKLGLTRGDTSSRLLLSITRGLGWFLPRRSLGRIPGDFKLSPGNLLSQYLRFIVSEFLGSISTERAHRQSHIQKKSTFLEYWKVLTHMFLPLFHSYQGKGPIPQETVSVLGKQINSKVGSDIVESQRSNLCR